MKHKSTIVLGKRLLVFFPLLFVVMGVAPTSHAQQRPGVSSAATLLTMPSGRADLEWQRQDQVLTVVLSVQGLAPGSVHASHIHVGTCSMKGGILYPLNPVVADAQGNATVRTTLTHLTGGIPATGWSIRVHRGARAQTSPLLCGNVVNRYEALLGEVPLN